MADDGCWGAGQNFGFEDLVEPMFEVGEDTFRLPLDELLQFEQADSGLSAGYKKASRPVYPLLSPATRLVAHPRTPLQAGGTNVDAKGNLDTVEFLQVRIDLYAQFLLT